MTNTDSEKALFVDDYLDMDEIDVYDTYPSMLYIIYYYYIS